MTLEHTATPWAEVEYDNDVGPNDEGFWEWYEIPNVGRFDKKADAEFARAAANCHDDLLAAAKIVLAGLDARIDAAPTTAKPVFNGIAELSDAINKAGP